MRTTTVLLLVVLFLAPLPATAGPRALDFDTFIKIQRLSKLAVSPDGKLLAYEIGTPDLDGNRIKTQVWVLDTVTGASRQMTHHAKNSGSPKFSPDGKSLYILSARDGARNIWRLPLDGGEARPVTTFDLDVTDYRPLPDGNCIVSLNILKACGTDLACTDKALKEKEDDPVQARVITAPYYRVFDAWQDGTVSHLFLWNAADGTLTDLTPDERHVPPQSLGNDTPFALSPDGGELAYTANRDPHVERSTNHDIFLRDLATGAVTNLTAANRGQDCGPLYSPDGTFIAFARMKREGFEADKQDLVLYDRQKKAFLNLTAGEDLSIAEYQWAPDSKAVWFTAEVHGRHWLYKADIATRTVEVVLRSHNPSSIVVDPGGGAIHFHHQLAHVPKEVFTLDLKTGKTAQRTFINKDLLADVELPPVEELSWKSTDGTTVWGFLMKPPAFNPAKKYPMVVLVHGGPQGNFGDDFHYRWNAEMFAAPGTVVFMPNFRGSTSYGEAYKDAITLHWGDRPYEDIMSGVDFVAATFPFVDGTRIAAAGASYGGYMMNWMAVHTPRFKAIVSHAGLWDIKSKYGCTDELWFPEWEFGGDPYHHPELYEKWNPAAFVLNLEKFRTPMLVVHGALDFRVAESQAFQLFQALQRLGVESKLLYFPDETHFVAKPRNAQLWWKEVLGFIAEHVR
jgi:dipeptidyl aminopeptidase/acylaminoacyl peptidase